MTIIYRYTESPTPNGKSVLRPMIPVTFFNNDEKIESIALLDSGADVSAMDIHMAEILGLDLSGKRFKSYGVTGSIDSIKSTIGIKVSKGHENYTFSIPIHVLITKDDERQTPTLIGRAVFFEHFKITFDEGSKKVMLKSTSKKL